MGGATPHHSGTLRSGRGVGGRGVWEAEWAVRLRGSGGRSRMRPLPQLRPGWSGSYLVVDTVVIAAAFLDGHAVLAVVEEALVTLAALSTAVWTLGGGTECGAAQGAGVCAELVVTVGGTLHGCKEGVWVKALGKEKLQDPGSAPAVPQLPPFSASHSRQKESVLQASTWPPIAWQALT